jgi:SAM-dependent methyltransferase
MHWIDQCPCCGQSLEAVCPALVAPFIAERVLGTEAFPCRLLNCPSCAFRCYDLRFDSEEMGRLYRGYREEEYYRARHRWEPWYSRRMNTSLSEDPAELQSRTRNLHGLVSRCLGGAAPDRILDFGGDRGQFIPSQWGGEKFVYEVSGRQPLPGIRGYADPAELAGQVFDLVMLCHVLEHVPDPGAQLDQVFPLLDGGGVLYVEVPLERPDLRRAGSRPWDKRGLHWLARHPWLLRGFDLYSTYFRIRRGFIPPWGFLKAQEHINFFTAQSLETLMLRKGFQVLACEELRFDGAYCKATAVGCVVRQPGLPQG